MRKLFAPFIGIISILLHILNLSVDCLVLFITLCLDKIFAFKVYQKIYDVLPVCWAWGARQIRRLGGTKIKVDLPADLNVNTFYLALSNYQSWTDIAVLYEVFHGRIPMLKFFAKKILLWVPLVGWACWGYGFPFLYRHTKAQLEKHPEWKRRDFEETRKACERFKQKPGTLMLFPEGTRFTKAKHQKQASPYPHLLKPKAGGTAFALQCMGDKIKTLVDITIIYHSKQKSFWDYCCGNTREIFVTARTIPLNDSLQGDYENDAVFRERFQAFLNQLWQEKETLIEDYIAHEKIDR